MALQGLGKGGSELFLSICNCRLYFSKGAVNVVASTIAGEVVVLLRLWLPFIELV
jgi:hypothetical protein